MTKGMVVFAALLFGVQAGAQAVQAQTLSQSLGPQPGESQVEIPDNEGKPLAEDFLLAKSRQALRREIRKQYLSNKMRLETEALAARQTIDLERLQRLQAEER